MATDIDGKPSLSPTQRLAIAREQNESPGAYLARLAAAYGIAGWEAMTVREFIESCQQAAPRVGP